MKMKMIRNGCAALALLAVSGCGTVMSRPTPTYVAPGLYPATRTDGALFWTCVSGASVFQEKGSGLAPLAGYTVVPLCFLIDIPLSLVADTVLLPMDIYRTDWQAVRERRAVEREMKYQQSLTLEDRQRLRDQNQENQKESNQAAHDTARKLADPGR